MNPVPFCSSTRSDSSKNIVLDKPPTRYNLIEKDVIATIREIHINVVIVKRVFLNSIDL